MKLAAPALSSLHTSAVSGVKEVHTSIPQTPILPPAVPSTVSSVTPSAALSQKPTVQSVTMPTPLPEAIHVPVLNNQSPVEKELLGPVDKSSQPEEEKKKDNKEKEEDNDQSVGKTTVTKKTSESNSESGDRNSSSIIRCDMEPDDGFMTRSTFHEKGRDKRQSRGATIMHAKPSRKDADDGGDGVVNMKRKREENGDAVAPANNGHDDILASATAAGGKEKKIKAIAGPSPQPESATHSKKQQQQQNQKQKQLKEKSRAESASSDNGTYSSSSTLEGGEAVWCPPVNQSGDGKTALNAKYGY
jgi:hypothetical protein